MEDCPICLSRKVLQEVLACKHAFCDECIVRSVTLKRACPLCRQSVLAIHPRPSTAAVTLPPDTDGQGVGIGLLPGSTGVIVCDVHKNGLAHSAGIKRGQVISHVNGVPFRKDHFDAAQMMNDCSIRSLPVHCALVRPKVRPTSLLRRLFW